MTCLNWKTLLELELNNSEARKKIQIITANQRLEKYLRHEYLSNESLNTTLYSPPISSLSQWYQNQFEYLQSHLPEHYGQFQVLNASQEQVLWATLISKHHGQTFPVLAQSCLNDVMQAHRQCVEWNIQPDSFNASHYYIGLDQAAFLVWQKEFIDYLQQHNYLSEYELPQIIIEALRNKNLPSADSYYFYGFDEPTPSFDDLQASLEYINAVTICVAKPEKMSDKQYLVVCQNKVEEINIAANWALSIQKKHAEARIGIVFPYLAENKEIIENQFLKVLRPESFQLGQDRYPLPFNISSGISLSSVPLVKSALDFLKLKNLSNKNSSIECEQILEIIYSPFLFNNVLDLNEASQISDAIRSLNQEKISLKQLREVSRAFKANLRFIEQASNSNPVIFKTIFDYIESSIHKAKHFEWRNFFITELQKAMWLKHHTLSSEQYQASRKFISALNTFITLDQVSPSCSFHDALERLSKILNNELFQVDSTLETHNQINILGVLEAAGQDYTHLWVCEMDDKTWPQVASPNPFLPISLQKDHSMPHSSSEKELAFSLAMTERFVRHSHECIFSFSAWDKDVELHASRIFTTLPKLSSEEFIIENNIKLTEQLARKISKSALLEDEKDESPLPPENIKTIRGGQAIIRDHNLCPFKSFVSYRLRIKPYQNFEHGISAMERGILLHKLMELFWQECKNQTSLIALNKTQVQEQLKRHTHHIQKIYAKDFQARPSALDIELARARSIAYSILELEKQRQPFQILALEQAQQHNFEGLELSLRIDRIDQLEDGRQVIIDYKSKRSSTSKWLTPRVEEPQLPLYASLNSKTSAIAFTALNTDPSELGFEGIGDRPAIALGIFDCHDEKKNKIFEHDWPSITKQWKSDLSFQVRDFLLGNYRLDPKVDEKTCEHCDYQRICRIKDRVIQEEVTQ